MSGDWASTWAQQVKDNGADALLLSVSAWDPAAGGAGLGGPAPKGDQLEPWLTARLSALVESLTQDGTTVVWVPLPDPNGDDLKKMAIDPTHAAFVRSFRTVFGNGGIDARFLDIQSEYNDRVREGSSTDRIGSVADLVAPRLTAIAQSTQPGVTRVVVLGDSVARSLGNGLSGWAAAEGSAAVWDLSHDGCGVWTAGDVQSLYAGTGPLPTSCTDGVDRWSREIADYRPEVVIVLSTIWDLADRKLPEWKRFRHPGDPVFDDALLARYRELIGQANAAGARVVWMTAPCTDPDNGGLPFGAPKARAAFDPARTAHLNRSVLPQLGSEVRVVDLFSLVCPGGRFTETVGPVTGARPDGLHFSESGARWLADTYASDWLGTGRSPA